MFDESSFRARHFVIRNTNSMSRQQDLADAIRRSMHDRLVAQVRLRQRNIVFPDTVRNEGAFYRNLAGNSIHAQTSHRLFALFFGFYVLSENLVLPVLLGGIHRSLQDLLLDVLMIAIGSSLWIAVGIKIIVNAVVREDQPKRNVAKTHPRVKI